MLSRAGWSAGCGLLGAAALFAAGTVPAAAAPRSAADSSPGQQVRALELPELEAIGADAAWSISRGTGVTVGVLDTGTDGTVADLAGSVSNGPDLLAGLDPAGYTPPHLHGTYIASLIAGHGSGPGDEGGVIGVAPQAQVLSVRVIPDDGEPGAGTSHSGGQFEDSLGEGIHYAVDHSVRVINLSLGGTYSTPDTRDAISYAISHNVVVVASAGNSGTAHGGYTPYGYPASFPGVISVAAVNTAGDRAGFSDRNAGVIISAPGVQVVGAAPGGQYLVADGTSPAAAFVTGVVALIKSRFPALSPALVEQALVSSTTHRPSGGYSPATGFGEVSAPAALAAAAQLASGPASRGIAPSARFVAGSPGAIQVVHLNHAKITGYTAAAVAAGLGFLVSLTFLLVASTRAARRRGRQSITQPTSSGPGDYTGDVRPG